MSEAEEVEQTVVAPPTKVAVVSATDPPPPPPRQMTREEFLRQMGLAADDLIDVQPPNSTSAANNRLSPERPAPPPLAGDAPAVIQDDQWVRTTVLADATLIQESAKDLAPNEARKSIMDSYRAQRSGGLSPDEHGAAASPDKTAVELVTEEDHAMAVDYKASLLEEFRKRKKNGEAKPQPPSPARNRTANMTA